jgi:hypothetical protein
MPLQEPRTASSPINSTTTFLNSHTCQNKARQVDAHAATFSNPYAQKQLIVAASLNYEGFFMPHSGFISA